MQECFKTLHATWMFNAASGHSYYFSETRCLSKESKGVQSTDASILGFAVFGHLNMTNNTNRRNKSRLMFGKQQKFDGQQPQDYIHALERARLLSFQRMVSGLYSSVPGLGQAQKKHRLGFCLDAKKQANGSVAKDAALKSFLTRLAQPISIIAKHRSPSKNPPIYFLLCRNLRH